MINQSECQSESTEDLLFQHKKRRENALTPGSQEQEEQQSEYELSTELRAEVGISLINCWMNGEMVGQKLN